MSPCRIAAVAAATAVVAAGAVTSSASARAGDKTFAQTFVSAGHLCQKTAAGTETRHLRPFAAAILADCTAFETAFNSAATTVRAARTAIAAQEAADNAAIAAACKPPATPGTSSTCATTLAVNTAALASLRKQRVLAARAFWLSADAARTVFWAEIKALPGEHHASADKPLPVQNS